MSSPAYFEFKGSGDTDFFTFQLLDPLKIAKARDIVSGKETRFVHPQGTIIQKTASYNPKWSYHFDPDSIEFFEMAIEVCDANMKYVEEHLDEVGGAFLPNSHWCPWNSTILREIPEINIPQ